MDEAIKSNEGFNLELKKINSELENVNSKKIYDSPNKNNTTINYSNVNSPIKMNNDRNNDREEMNKEKKHDINNNDKNNNDRSNKKNIEFQQKYIIEITYLKKIFEDYKNKTSSDVGHNLYTFKLH